ncbi:MAG: amidohydrolase family protein [Halioglobus sp.]
MEQYDTIIRNGEIYDGSGDAPYHGDIAVKNGKIAAIADSIEGHASQEIDATGKIVTPGFVDCHTHYDGQATWDTHMRPSSSLGCTTAVMGNCGVGFAPCRKEDHSVLMQLMEGVEEIPGTVMDAGLPWNWESFPEFLDALDVSPRDIDVAALLPHGPLRVYVMGERGLNREAATDEDIKQMQTLLSAGVAAGAVGFSSSRTLLHLSSSGENVPTFKAATSELKQLGDCLSGEQGHVMQFISDWEDMADEFNILRDTCRSTGAKGTFTLAPIESPSKGMNRDGELWKSQLRMVEEAQAEGLDIRGQVISRPIGVLMGHPATMSPFRYRPSFRALDELPADQRLEALRDPVTKARIMSEDHENPHIFVKLLSKRFDLMYPLEDPIEYLPSPDSSVAAQALRDGVDPESWLYDYFLGNEGTKLIYIPGTSANEEVIATLLEHPHTVSALGDGGAHVGSICDASATIYVLTKWVREKEQFNLAQGIHMISRQPAELYSLNDRGLIATGMKADINIIDFERLKLRSPHIVQDLPAGGKRFLQDVDGIEATLVSGEIIFSHGQATGALPGKLIRGMQAAPA